MPEIDRAADRLTAMGVTSIHISPGTDPATPEQVVGQINQMLDALETGDYDDITDEVI